MEDGAVLLLIAGRRRRRRRRIQIRIHIDIDIGILHRLPDRRAGRGELDRPYLLFLVLAIRAIASSDPNPARPFPRRPLPNTLGQLPVKAGAVFGDDPIEHGLGIARHNVGRRQSQQPAAVRRHVCKGGGAVGPDAVCEGHAREAVQQRRVRGVTGTSGTTSSSSRASAGAVVQPPPLGARVTYAAAVHRRPLHVTCHSLCPIRRGAYEETNGSTLRDHAAMECSANAMDMMKLKKILIVHGCINGPI